MQAKGFQSAFRIFFVLSVVLGVFPARADPGPIGKWLMKTNVSLFSFGLHRLEEHLNDVSKYLHIIGARVHFNWEDNRIIVSTYAPFDSANKFDEELCSILLNGLRSNGGYNDNKKQFDAVNSIWMMKFESIGYNVIGSPKEFREKFAKIFFVYVYAPTLWIHTEPPNPKGNLASCGGPLVSKEVYYSRRGKLEKNKKPWANYQ